MHMHGLALSSTWGVRQSHPGADDRAFGTSPSSHPLAIHTTGASGADGHRGRRAGRCHVRDLARGRSGVRGRTAPDPPGHSDEGVFALAGEPRKRFRSGMALRHLTFVVVPLVCLQVGQTKRGLEARPISAVAHMGCLCACSPQRWGIGRPRDCRCSERCSCDAPPSVIARLATPLSFSHADLPA